MRSHKVQNLNTEVYCNCCGSKITNINDQITKKDYLHIDKKWGYFSQWDMEEHTFDICETCYKKWITSFVISVQADETEDIVISDEHAYTDSELKQLNDAYESEMKINK